MGLRSGRLHVWEVLCAVLAKDLSHPRPLRGAGCSKANEQLPLAVDGSPGDQPAHRQPLEQELDRALPGVLLGFGSPGPPTPESVCAYSRRAAGVSEPRKVSTLPSGSV